MKTTLRNSIIASSYCLIFFLFACQVPNQDPAATTKAFYEALANKDFDEAKKLATTDSKTMINLIKSMGEMGAEINGSNKDLDKIKTAIYTTDNINGEKATVRVKVGNEENIVKLKKEDGAWKVALDKESLKETIGESTIESTKKIQGALKSAGKELENLDDSIANALKKAGAVLKSDSVRQVIEKVGEALKKTGDALQEASKQ